MEEPSMMADTAAPAAGSGQSQPVASTSQGPISSMASLFLDPEPDDLVTLKAGDKSFTFFKSMLVQDSDYFAACLNNPSFIEGQTSTVEFDDIGPVHLGIYLSLVYFNATRMNTACYDACFGQYGSQLKFRNLTALTKVYQVADRFLSKTLLPVIHSKILEIANMTPYTSNRPRISKLPRIRKRNMKLRSKSSKAVVKVFKKSFAALHKNVPGQAKIRTELADIFCRQFPVKKISNILHILNDNPEFTEAVFLALVKKTTKVEKKIVQLHRKNPNDTELNDMVEDVVGGGYYRSWAE